MDKDTKKEIISKMLSETILRIIDLSDINFEDKFSNASAEILGQIVEIVKNKELDDFEAMEEIVCVLEQSGIDCGSRHDFRKNSYIKH